MNPGDGTLTSDLWVGFTPVRVQVNDNPEWFLSAAGSLPLTSGLGETSENVRGGKEAQGSGAWPGWPRVLRADDAPAPMDGSEAGIQATGWPRVTWQTGTLTLLPAHRSNVCV